MKHRKLAMGGLKSMKFRQAVSLFPVSRRRSFAQRFQSMVSRRLDEIIES
jgi:hypothetical protein